MGRIFAFKNSWPKHATNIFGRVKYMYLNLNKIFIACFGHEICLKANFLPGFIQVLFITSCTTDTVFTFFIFVGYIACSLMMKYFVNIFRPYKRFFSLNFTYSEQIWLEPTKKYCYYVTEFENYLLKVSLTTLLRTWIVSSI